jgi:hypothetical protein
MAPSGAPALYKLPDELLLQVTDHLRAYTSTKQLQHLCKLCLVSKRLVPIAQEQLYANAVLHISCGCHPNVNAAIQLLRTLLDRPDLASKIEGLRFCVVRRSIKTLYESKGFDLSKLRDKCFAMLSELGYTSEHPWWAALQHDVESAYAGVLLSLLPKLQTLDLTAKDHHRTFPTMDPVSAFFGTSTPPAQTRNALATVHKFVGSDFAFLRDMPFKNLRVVNLRRIDIGTVLRLNGPNTLPGATQLEDLSLGVSIQFLDEDYSNSMQVSLGDVFAALGCKKISRLSITLSCIDTYTSLGVERDFRTNHFMSQLHGVASTLRTLEIDLDHHEDSEEWHWLLSQITKTVQSLEEFSQLQRLMIPMDFVTADHSGSHGILPENLPRTIQRLNVVAPGADIIAWANILSGSDDDVDLPDFRTICLQCRDNVNMSKTDFTEDVESVWWDLKELRKMKIFVCDIADGEETDLAKLYETQNDMDLESDPDDDGDDSSLLGDSLDDTDDDMPGLIVDGMD